MKRRLLAIIARPIDKNSLELMKFVSNDEEVVEGVLICLKCNRIYPIVQGIPILLQEELTEGDRARIHGALEGDQ
jgi:uncharacterized protein YbaR (Trm112 family)